MSELSHPGAARAENSTTVRSESGTEAPAGVRAARAALRLAAAASPELAAGLAERLFTAPQRRPRPAHEHDALRRARRFLIPFRDQALAAWEWGEAGPRVLVVHGWEGRAAQLAPIAERLAALGFRVVGFDGPAHGESPGESCTFFDFAEAIEAAADALGPLHALVAHSMGGASALWAMRARPLAKRYAFLAPPSDLRDFTRGFARLVELDDDVRARLEARLERRHGVRLEDARAERTAAGQRAPLLVVHDLGDREVPFEKGRAIAEAWPGATLLRTEGLGHQRILRDADVVRSVERFVAWALVG